MTVTRSPAKTAPEAIAETLMADIRNGLIPEGTSLPSERVLCDRFGTSRPTVRAALLALQARGFASLESTKRPRACKPSIGSVFQAAGKELSDLLGATESGAYLDQVRQFIEVGAVRLAAQEASNLQLAQINAALEKGYHALDNDAEFARADAGFHRAIVSVVRNPVILELHDRFVFDIVAGRPVDTSQIERNRISYEEHRIIYQAIAENDPERAMAVMDRHLARSYRDKLPQPARLRPGSESP